MRLLLYRDLSGQPMNADQSAGIRGLMDELHASERRARVAGLISGFLQRPTAAFEPGARTPEQAYLGHLPRIVAA